MNVEEGSEWRVFVGYSPGLQGPCGTEDVSGRQTSYHRLWFEEGEPLPVVSFRQILNFEI